MASKQTEDARGRKLAIANRLVIMAGRYTSDQETHDLEVSVHLLRQTSVAQFKRAVAAYNKDHGMYQRQPKPQKGAAT